jgi:hypothetical protein
VQSRDWEVVKAEGALVADLEDQLFRELRKCARLLGNGIITPDELVGKLMDLLATDWRERTHLATEVVAAVPEVALGELRDRVAAVLRPGYRRLAWSYGGPVAPSADYLERESADLTARERAWAARLAELLGVTAEQGAAPDPARR